MDSTRATRSASEELELLAQMLPAPLRAALERVPHEELLEVVLDLGRLPEARLTARVAPRPSPRPTWTTCSLG